MICLIVARSKNNVIGKNGEIPWKIKGEQQQFKELTTGKYVVMGRRSYDEIGHPLPNRNTIVISRTKKYEGKNLISVSSLKDAISYANGEDIYIAGGYGLYKEAIPFVDTMYITEIDLEIENGDVFFPEFDLDDFDFSRGETLGDQIKYTRTIYKRKTMSNKTNIIFVRRAQSAYGNDDRIRPLTESGLKCREIVVETLKDRHIDVFLSSPYKRSVDTIQTTADFSCAEKGGECLASVQARSFSKRKN